MFLSVFQERPEIPPSHAQAAARQISPESYSYTASILRLFRNKAFILLVITYGEYHSEHNGDIQDLKLGFIMLAAI